MKIFIKYMVSQRCKMAVKAELNKLGLHYIVVDLGEVEIKENLDQDQLNQLNAGLQKSGLELMDNKKSILIEKIKLLILNTVHGSDQPHKVAIPEMLSSELNHDYTYLANIFSEVTGLTIEHFLIAHKIERVKELLIYNELTLTEIAYQLNYSSVAHLSNQFKKVTGLTPTFFKDLKHKKRNTLENV